MDHLQGTDAVLQETESTIEAFGIAALIRPAREFVRARRMWAPLANADDLARWAPVFAQQYEVARVAAASVLQVTEIARNLQLDVADIGVQSPHPVGVTLRAYAEAAGSSHHQASAVALLQRAQQAQANIGLASLERDNEAVATSIATLPPGSRRDDLAAQLEQSTRAVADLRHESSPEAAELAAIESELLRFRTQLAQLSHQLAVTSKAVATAQQADIVANLLWRSSIAAEFRAASQSVELIDKTLAANTRAKILARFENVPASPERERAVHAQLTEARRESLQTARDGFATVVKTHGLDKELFERAREIIEDAQLNQLLTDLFIMVALTIATNGIAAFAGSFAAGVFAGSRVAVTAFEAASLVRATRYVAVGTEFVADAFLGAAATTAVFKDSLGAGFVENLMTSAAVLAALRPLQQLARRWGAIDEQLFAMWERNGSYFKLAAAKTTIASAEMVLGAATAFVVHRVAQLAKGETPDEQTVASWAAQGATMALGRFITSQLTTAIERLTKLGSHAGTLVGGMMQQRHLAHAVETSGNPDAGLELIAKHNELLQQEVEVWKSLERDPELARSLGVHANDIAAHLHASSTQFADTGRKLQVQLPLRLAGLEQEIPGGRLWVGDTEQIAVALRQAERAGATVVIDEMGAVGRMWRVTIGDENVVIRERARFGRVREALLGSQVTDAHVAETQRYAEAARALNDKMRAKTKAIVDGTENFATDVLHIGDAFAGVMNRNTQHTDGEHRDPRHELVIASNDGAMTNRGGLPSGQNAELQTMPGIRTREHTTDHEAFSTSKQLGDATDIGRLEMQTPTYRGWISKLEVRERVPADQWARPDRKYRVSVHTTDGTVRMVYASRVEDASGMGPSNLSPAQQKVGDPSMSPAARLELYDHLRATGKLVGADDPNIVDSMIPGERILVWGGSPTGAWAAEDAARRGASANIVGEDRDPSSAAAFAAELQRVAATGDAQRVEEMLRSRIGKTHSGSTLRRNRGPGTPFGENAAGHGIDVELGIPSQIQLRPDGKLDITIEHGQNPGTRTYDRIFVAIGQDAYQPGGMASRLGPGARGDAPVPEGSIELRIVIDAANNLVGLETADGSLRLVGAAFAMKPLAAWVRTQDRDRFLELLEDSGRMATDPKYSGNRPAMSVDSAGVTPGIEAMKYSVPESNRTYSDRDFRLPASIPADHLDLPLATELWPMHLSWYFERATGRKAGSLLVASAGVISGVHFYTVRHGDRHLGIARIFTTLHGNQSNSPSTLANGMSMDFTARHSTDE